MSIQKCLPSKGLADVYRYGAVAAFFLIAHYSIVPLIRISFLLLYAILALKITISIALIRSLPDTTDERPCQHGASLSIPRSAAMLAILFGQTLLLQGALALIGAGGSPRPSSIALLTQQRPLFQIIAIILAACDEELFFRAATLRLLQRRKVAYAPAIVWSALLFATFHLTTGIASALHALCAGVWLAIWYLRYRSLFLIVTLHALYNGIVLLV